MKACKIIATAFNPKRVVKNQQNWPHHGQQLNNHPLYIEMIGFLVNIERTHDPGMEVDTYIYVYKDSMDIWKEWMQFDKTPTKGGMMHIVVEEENGGNYMMFNNAYQTLKGEYEWFMYTVDDVVIFGDQYYRRIKDCWAEGVGYVALQGFTDVHVQGSIGLTHRDVLAKVCEINGGVLPHAKGPWTQEANIHEGELPFTGKVLDAGFKFVSFNESTVWHKDNLCYPYYNFKNNV